MGREGLIPRAQAAELLGVSPRHVSYLARRGRLQSTLDGLQELFDVEEVAAYAEAGERGKSLSEVAETARLALATAKLAQRRVKLFERLAGLDLPELEHTREAILSLRALADEDMRRNVSSVDKLNFWADQLFRMGDIYLEEVAQVGFELPYEPYLTLCHQLLLTEDPADSDPAASLAYKRLRNARQRFRESIFVYYLRMEGKRSAFARFPSDFYGPHYDIMMLATEE